MTPVLNAVETLPATLASIRAIKTAEIEYVVVDGGSDDGTRELLDQHADLIDVLVSEEDRGITEALNRGLGLSHGTYVGSLNADDSYDVPGMQRLISMAKQDALQGDIVFGDCVLVDPLTSEQFLRVATLEGIDRFMTLYHPSMFVRRSLFERLGGYDTQYRLAMDCEFVHRALASKAKFQKVPLVLSKMALYGQSHRKLGQALGEFRRSSISHGLQNATLAWLFWMRQFAFHKAVTWRPARLVWQWIRG